MDLPPDKAKLLKNYDNDRKWEIICDRVSAIGVSMSPLSVIYDRSINSECCWSAG